MIMIVIIKLNVIIWTWSVKLNVITNS